MSEEAYEFVAGIGTLLYGVFVAFVMYKIVVLLGPLDAGLGMKALLGMLMFIAAIVVSLPFASLAGMLLAFLWGSSYVIYHLVCWATRRIRGVSARPLP